ncbi:hypothetical protein [Halopelagius longus]|uniref:Uncharacterized protein n=1 Tax=Halopelagius longus TaxID=1236180 RepID=A0A1H1DNY3_9EURY|nr:hypothetical protein [Halopelagius longus]RDI71412.1 hypothetical protein DWB78_06555 [Halopelagius longus]SDQ78251.1 hypothetical protein SAMN05216278_2509 [Halopelagius longus]
MNRRTVLTGTAALLPLALAGCLGGSAGSDGETDTETEQTETETTGTDELPTTGDGTSGTHPRFTESSLTPRDECSSPGEASVAFDDEGVTVTGCIVGKNGCTVPSMEDLTYDGREGLVTLVVAAVEERDDDEMCTEALENLGYEARVALDGTVPSAVAVVHDDVNGKREVAREER